MNLPAADSVVTGRATTARRGADRPVSSRVPSGATTCLSRRNPRSGERLSDRLAVLVPDADRAVVVAAADDHVAVAEAPDGNCFDVATVAISVRPIGAPC